MSDTTVATVKPNLTGRNAKCDLCPRMEPSGQGLAFFGYKPDQEFDGFYCGCKGWS